MSAADSKTPLELLIARSDADRERVQQFRYEVLVSELGGALAHADHNRKVIRDALDDGAIHVYATDNTQIVGAARITVGGLGGVPDELRAAFQIDRFAAYCGSALSLTDCLVIAPRWRSSPAASLLLAAAFKLARKHGSRFDFAYCPPALVQLYERLGYRRYADNFRDADNTYQVPLVMLLEDNAHLAVIKSPFARMAHTAVHSRETAYWFARNFPEAMARPNEQSMTEDRFWEYLTARLHEFPQHGVPLLAGLAHHEAKRFLTVGTVLSCRAGDCIVHQGDIGREMFVLLAGEAEVRVHRNALDKPGMLEAGTIAVASFTRGDVFGEMAYIADTPRTADVVAKTDIEVLVLNQETMRKAMRQMPEIAAKVLFNLSLILCGRLRQSTQAWMAHQTAAE
jgi:CRP-like cAMP-binding protein/GNAT superfamily N-acetyltransferase